MTVRIVTTQTGFKVLDCRPVLVVETTYRQGVEASRVEAMMESVFGRYGYSREGNPIFATAYDADSGLWSTDIACGLQRWKGYKTTRQITQALRKLDVAEETIRTTVKAAKALNGRHVTGVW